MPLKDQYGSKTAHIDLLKSPDVQSFLLNCQQICVAGDSEAAALCSAFTPPPVTTEQLPEFICAWDGSKYEASVDETNLPNTLMGFVKILGMLIDLRASARIRNEDTGMIDPYRFSAAIFGNKTPLHVVLPSSNLRYKGSATVSDGLRQALDYWLRHESLSLRNADGSLMTLLSTLYLLASYRPDHQATSGTETREESKANLIKLAKCPVCEDDCGGNIVIRESDKAPSCPSCSERLYPSDCLRIHESFNEFGHNEEMLSRSMMVLEHLMVAHYHRHFMENAPHRLQKIAFFIDGPLAIFGQPAWLHACLMKYYFDGAEDLRARGMKPPLILGIQKSGHINDYMRLLQNHLGNDMLLCLSDEYRYRYICPGRQKAGKTFGYETYYGQDFLYKTKTGRNIVFNLPYPFREKASRTNTSSFASFRDGKASPSAYDNLSIAVRLINQVETDMFSDALIPTALAHRFASISLSPGGRALDILASGILNGASSGGLEPMG